MLSYSQKIVYHRNLVKKKPYNHVIIIVVPYGAACTCLISKLCYQSIASNGSPPKGDNLRPQPDFVDLHAIYKSI